MFMIQKQVITCDDCPHLQYTSGHLEHFWCGNEERQLPNKDLPKIPEWCGLNKVSEEWL